MSIPEFLINRYKDWKSQNFNKNKDFYEKISINSQKPKAIIISCCDSRVNPTKIFKAEDGDFFIHRNIANIIPQINDAESNLNTSSAIEYAVKVLRVKHIIILGHSSCGGIEYGYKSFIEKKINIDLKFTNVWLSQIKSLYYDNKGESIEIIGKENVKHSINNLLTYPYINQLFDQNKIQIHGLFHNIGTGQIMYFNKITNKFEILNHL